jgi:lipopolysaccharide export LptBFGC system permease protein LptF
MEMKHSIGNQIIDVVKVTFYSLPSFINSLAPFILLISGIFLNSNLRNNNEIIIIKQYFSKKEINFTYTTIFIFIISIFIANNEFIAKKSYQNYKIKEIELRNNLKIGSPIRNEFHIDGIASIFFKEKKSNSFINVDAIILSDNHFIKSESAKIEQSKKNINIIFYNGERLTLNKIEKSKTKFDKYIHSFNNKNLEEISFDKEHFNTFELLNHNDTEFINHGHNKIIQYFLVIIFTIISVRVLFDYKFRSKINIFYLKIFILLLLSQILNSYLIYLINSKIVLNLNLYYTVMLIFGSSILYYTIRDIR